MAGDLLCPKQGRMLLAHGRADCPGKKGKSPHPELEFLSDFSAVVCRVPCALLFIRSLRATEHNFLVLFFIFLNSFLFCLLDYPMNFMWSEAIRTCILVYNA